jgi:hypothetical protein
MRFQRVEPKQVARHQELADLPAPVLHQLDHPHAAAQNSIARARRLSLAMNFLIALDRDGCTELFQQIERVARR